MNALTPVVIIGASGHGRELLDVIESINSMRPTYDVLGFLDDWDLDPQTLERRGTRLMGPVADISSMRTKYALGIADPQIKKRVDMFLRDSHEPITLIHPTATVGGDVQMEPGSILTAHSSVTTNVRLGRHVHLNLHAAVGHDSVVDDYSTINPGATVGGNVRLHTGVLVGTNAAILQGISVGEYSTVGAGAVVVKDVASNITVVGVPARRLPT